jgi:hypothetical protein
MPTSSASWGKDTVERVLATVVELVLGAATAAFIQKISGTETVTLDSVFQALTAGATAGYAVLKAYLAKLVQNAISPASLAPADTPTP